MRSLVERELTLELDTLDAELAPAPPDASPPPLAGWKPKMLPDRSWGSIYEGFEPQRCEKLL